ncbi:YbaK/EbsC family protein [Agromyces archimandritae]|uniref:YbaK/aminoacyl-tRNA synthetase-associated domain-containing protein n=1 Tax=Agromyces archimandritae TaxID=2781962 RepID=A0A975FP57_9MICO|nr:YbaK/EbsC family protein [Agromyces archimandritae]QTX05785.1 hypothetical protein G127AT_06160 [Agromyces archimandritae]
MRFGSLDFAPAADHPELLAPPVAAAVAELPREAVLVSAIDPEAADTAVFCERYGIGMDEGANCVIVEGRRGERVVHAAVMVRGADRADVNGAVRRFLDVRKVSFAAFELAPVLTGMVSGGITPVGLPDGWPILVDEAVAAAPNLIIGSGVRGSKLLVSGATLAALRGAAVLPLARVAA